MAQLDSIRLTLLREAYCCQGCCIIQRYHDVVTAAAQVSVTASTAFYPWLLQQPALEHLSAFML